MPVSSVNETHRVPTLLDDCDVLLLKPGLVKFQRPAVLGDGAHHVFGRAVGNVGADLDGDPHVCPDQTCQVLHDGIGDLFGAAGQPVRITQRRAAVEASWLLRLGGRRLDRRADARQLGLMFRSAAVARVQS